MKAILYTRYGSPDVLQLTEVEKPIPGDTEVLVKVYAASVNPLDWHRLRADPFLVRLADGMLRPKNPKLGADMAGVVEAVGKDVTRFKVGDEVFGNAYAGSFAEYVIVRENAIALKPSNLSFEETAAIPVAGFTALQGLRDAGKIKPGQKVLINGASGGVGTFAVQIAKSYGTEITGVCSTRNLDMVRSIGADHVIDYTREDFTHTGQTYDLIYDAIGNRSVFALRRALKPHGICAIAGFGGLPRMLEHVVVGGWVSRGDQKIGLMETAKTSVDDLTFMTELIEAGKVRPVIDRCYTLNEVPEAIRYLETSRARGKVVIQVTPNRN